LSTLQLLRETIAIILAGGQGERLYPLTRDRSKPAVPFGSVYRIIDFTLSNCFNSGLRRVFVFTQYKSFSLDKHLQRGWNVFSYEAGEFLYRIPPQHRVGTKWYEGTADAVYHNIYLLESHRPAQVLILSGDHVYKMDYGELLQYHREHGGEATLAAAVVPREGAHRFGIVAVEGGGRVVGFQEKPDDPQPLPDDPDNCLVNMGVYVFDTESLVREVCLDARDPRSSHDFGRNILPAFQQRGRLYAYPFRVAATGRPAYWRDIGTLDSYYEASMDLVARSPQLDLYDRNWPFRTWQVPVPPAKSVHGFTEDGQLAGTLENSIIGGGSVVSGARVEHSILGRGVRVNSYARLIDSIIMDGAQIGRYAELRRVICDKNVVIPEGMVIGADPERDRQLFRVTEHGITVIPKGMDLSE
jgi:glucose-1-phosphate adenylyltransferase